jgi:hypothetical protein
MIEWEQNAAGSAMETALEDLVKQAKDGKKEALESLVRRIQDRVYGLSLRMLGYPADAEDAAQETLVKVVTHLDRFRQESAFTTLPCDLIKGSRMERIPNCGHFIQEDRPERTGSSAKSARGMMTVVRSSHRPGS